jgi:uncharacterized glyoxalase superfamily protein PhnB
MTKKIPEGFHTITPHLMLNDAAKALELYKEAFGIKDIQVCANDDGKIMHAVFTLGNSKVFIADVVPGSCSGDTPSTQHFYLYVEDVDAAFAKAKKAGLTEVFPVSDMFWGDRMGALKDSFGMQWTIATHVRDVSPEEIAEGSKKMMAERATA